MTTRARIRFFGHATFGVELPGGAHLCIDPYEAGAYGGKVALDPLPDVFSHVVCSHWHGDHNAWHTLPSAQRIFDGHDNGTWSLRTRTAFHDEHLGRLRGGTTDILDIRADGARIVFCGDLGERATGALLEFVSTPRPDVLIVPVGGHFTLEADGAAELVTLARPRAVIACHSADDGTCFAELAPRGLFDMRFERHIDAGSFYDLPDDDDVDVVSTAVVTIQRSSSSTTR